MQETPHGGALLQTFSRHPETRPNPFGRITRLYMRIAMRESERFFLGEASVAYAQTERKKQEAPGHHPQDLPEKVRTQQGSDRCPVNTTDAVRVTPHQASGSLPRRMPGKNAPAEGVCYRPCPAPHATAARPPRVRFTPFVHLEVRPGDESQRHDSVINAHIIGQERNGFGHLVSDRPVSSTDHKCGPCGGPRRPNPGSRYASRRRKGLPLPQMRAARKMQ